MTVIADILLIFAGTVLAIPVAVLFLQTLASLPPRRAAKIPYGPRPRIAVLVPAHNEEFSIRKTLASTARQLAATDRLVVIADNCTDGTAVAARQQGVEVTVRSDPALRGKGYALDHGLRFLEQSGAPDIVIFIDADCQPKHSCIARLALSSFHAMRPAQAAYLMNPPRQARKTAAIVSFAWRVKDFVRPLGWHRLGLPCQLAGSGMAFPWETARLSNLASSDLAEDLKQGVDLALMGVFPLFCPDAVVTSDVAAGGTPSKSQRARWEHGTIEIILRYLPRLLTRFCEAPSLSLLAVALDLSVPPLALLALLTGLELILTLAAFFTLGTSLPVIVSGIVCAFFLAAIVLAWWRHGRDILPLHWLIFAPVYAVMKIPLYGRFFFNRQRAWVRGERRSMP
jgi:cellulose synthase/poly-beta-1,6-N-acetylglucosamine synthase-like glycosyltransferase